MLRRADSRPSRRHAGKDPAQRKPSRLRIGKRRCRFSYLDDNKKPIGYALDLCLKIADAIKHELKLPKLDVAYLCGDAFQPHSRDRGRQGRSRMRLDHQ